MPIVHSSRSVVGPVVQLYVHVSEPRSRALMAAGIAVPPLIQAHLSNQGIDMLIGRDVLDDCLMVYNGPDGTFTLAFE